MTIPEVTINEYGVTELNNSVIVRATITNNTAERLEGCTKLSALVFCDILNFIDSPSGPCHIIEAEGVCYFIHKFPKETELDDLPISICIYFELREEE